MERRAEPRFDVFAQIRVMCGTVNYLMNVRNISCSGMFVATGGGTGTPPGLQVGQPVDADLFIPDIVDNLRVEGEIMRLVDFGPTEKQGFGVRFFDLSADVLELLEDLVFRARQKSIIPPPLPGPVQK